MKWITVLLLSVTLASACTTTGSASCAGWKPIRLDAQSIDGMTDRDARDILAHNEFWLERCK